MTAPPSVARLRIATFLRRALFPVAFIVAALVNGEARAHDARPLSINMVEQDGGLYRVRLRIPPTVEVDNRPKLIWPGGCRALNDGSGGDALTGSQTILVACKNGLEGQRLTVRYPYYNPSLATLLRLNRKDGKVFTELFSPDQLDLPLPTRTGPLGIALDYLKLGIGHIWTGFDHLLFVTGLLILAGSMRRILLTITGFTVAHSITLSLSALNLVVLPVAPVEAAIALSILFVAREVARAGGDGLAARYPMVVASSFGLLHGFGFAAALRETGIADGELAISLLFFNLGVEMGQIMFIAVVGIAFLLVRAALSKTWSNLPPLRGRLTLLAGYALGIPAAFLLVQRLQAF